VKSLRRNARSWLFENDCGQIDLRQQCTRFLIDWARHSFHFFAYLFLLIVLIEAGCGVYGGTLLTGGQPCPPVCGPIMPAPAPAPTPVPDSDGDNISDAFDNCMLAPNPDQSDCDFDGSGDACEPGEDCDGDTVLNGIDNCPNAPNPDQADANSNGVGDLCE
jgi:hypothetical protein